MKKTLRSFAAAALALIALSCASDSRVRYHFDSDATAQERAAFTQAGEQWNQVVIDDHTISLDPDGEWKVTFTDSDDVLSRSYDGRTCRNLKDAAKDCRFDHWIRIRRGLPGTYTVDVARHEQGHALGLEHIPANEVGTMNPDHAAPTLTDADMHECLRADACGSITESPVAAFTY